MGLFSKKLTPQQELEIQEFSNTLYKVRQECEEALYNMVSETKDLYHICRQALREDRDLKSNEYLLDVVGNYRYPNYVPKVPEETIDISTLIEKAKESIQVYGDFLAHTQTKALSLRPANWYPKKYKKVYDSWASYFNLRRQHLEMATHALQPPDPLKHDPRHGNDKLNEFVYALNTIAMFSQEIYMPKDL